MGGSGKLYKGEMVRESADDSITRTLVAEGWSLTPPGVVATAAQQEAIRTAAANAEARPKRAKRAGDPEIVEPDGVVVAAVEEVKPTNGKAKR